jgi:hypothetical protein
MLLELKMGAKDAGQLIGDPLQLGEVAVLVPDVRDLDCDVEDRLMLCVDLRLPDLEVVSPDHQLFQGLARQGVGARRAIGEAAG